jgi:hypothetical protein
MSFPNLSGSRTNSPKAEATPGLDKIPKAFLVCGLVAILYTALASLIWSTALSRLVSRNSISLYV